MAAVIHVWRADGRELYFLNGSDAMLMSVPLRLTPRWDPGTAQALFLSGATRINANQQYAATRDGSRFLVNSRPQQTSVEPLTVVLNWRATIQK